MQDTETAVRVRDGMVVYSMIPEVAQELSVLLYAIGVRSEDEGWLKDAKALAEAVGEAEATDA